MLFAIAKSLFGARTKRAEAAPLKDATDEELMVAYATQGNVNAFELLVKRHERGVYNFILRSVGRKDLAEELLQDTFLRVVKSAEKYKQTAKFTTWVYTIARNLCIDRARRKGGKHDLSLDKTVGDDDGGATFLERVADQRGTTSTAYDRSVFRERLAAALEDLPEEQREVFLMRQVSGLKFREVSEVLGIPVPTVKSRMRYALEFLRGRLAEFEGQSFDDDDYETNVPGGE